ncbi:MAG: trehalose-phosphatase [Acidobacteria bacterium]|nr:trehalose-phosphatase [Acidobacteriota bacterium]
MARQAALDLPWALDPGQLDRWLAPVRAGSVMLFLDYDGTLTPIVERPEQARLAESTRALLADLAARCAVTIVTGRDVTVVQRFVGLDTLGYAGSHGFDIVGPSGSGLRREIARDCLPVLDRAEALLRRALEGIEGVLVERKRFGVASHVRRVAPADRPRVEAAVAGVASGFPELRRGQGKAVHELRPNLLWDKGAAVSWLVRRMGGTLDAVVYFGDDLTDEDAFARLDGAGTAIVVTAEDRPTSARLRLNDPEEVGVALGRMLAAMPARH